MTQQRCSTSWQIRRVNAPIKNLVSKCMVAVNLHDLVFSIGRLNLYPDHRKYAPSHLWAGTAPPCWMDSARIVYESL